MKKSKVLKMVIGVGVGLAVASSVAFAGETADSKGAVSTSNMAQALTLQKLNKKMWNFKRATLLQIAHFLDISKTKVSTMVCTDKATAYQGVSQEDAGKVHLFMFAVPDYMNVKFLIDENGHPYLLKSQKGKREFYGGMGREYGCPFLGVKPVSDVENLYSLFCIDSEPKPRIKKTLLCSPPHQPQYVKDAK